MSRREFLAAAMGAMAAKAVEGAAAPPPEAKPELRGSPKSLDRQNLIALVDNLTPIESKQQLAEFVAKKLLVPLPESGNLEVAKNLQDEKRNYCRPWVKDFLVKLRDDFRVLHPKTELKISSAVRPEGLGKVNKNASPRSTHPVGNTIDISYINLNRKERTWMEKYLKNWEAKTFTATVPPPPQRNRDQQEWFEKLSKGEKQILQKAPRSANGGSNISLPVVESTKEYAQHCYHFAVARAFENFVKKAQ